MAQQTLVNRSTKAGARTPATRTAAADGRPRAQALNEGRGANPGDTSNVVILWLATMVAQRRPGREPRRHVRPALHDPPAIPLNEGRGANPGDTWGPARSTARPRSAQRRPGREPRRHRPATSTLQLTQGAQRRPGREPRRHGCWRRVGDWDCHAQRRPGREPRRHPSASRTGWTIRWSLNEGRGANPGDTPATSARSCGPPTLNEGRGANPGDTGSGPGRVSDDASRSTKAGARTPATRGR